MTDGEAAWVKAIRRLGPALNTIKFEPLCAEARRVEVEIREEAYTALEQSDWRTAHDLILQLLELSKFINLVCRR